jgi:hypothetical protein
VLNSAALCPSATSLTARHQVTPVMAPSLHVHEGNVLPVAVTPAPARRDNHPHHVASITLKITETSHE